MMMEGLSVNNGRCRSSFRDPSGFLFWRNGALYRQINTCYQETYGLLKASALYDTLVKSGKLIPHEEVAIEPELPERAYTIIQPALIPFISYPYEWSFSQLKDAALLTLNIQETALSHGMSLKDGSAYNVQFYQGKPIFLDTLSFEPYQEGLPWVAYRQFCQHFLGPLALMAYTDIRLQQLLRVHIDGIPLDLASKLLPFSTKFRFSLLLHLHLHAASQRRFAGKSNKITARKNVNRRAMLGLIDSLKSAIRSLTWQPRGTEWADYYQDTNYSPTALQHKEEIVRTFLETLSPESAWDLGANVGKFSRIASDLQIPTIAFDVDPAAVERLYLETRKTSDSYLQPLLLDLANPSPSIGWQNQERLSLQERASADTVLALALIHHLAISNNVPLDALAEFFSTLCRHLIIEFVPKTDSQVQRLLVTREDIFETYTQSEFERSFALYFTIEQSVMIQETDRKLYLMKKR
jgi:hypothetical protein